MNDRHPPLVLWGAAGHARVVADIVRRQGRFTIVGFIDDAGQAGAPFCGGTVLGDRAVLPDLRRQGVAHALIAVGDCAARLALAAEAAGHGFAFPTAIHPFTSIAADARLGDGTVVAAGAVVGPLAEIGRHVIVNTGASVDHECTLGDGVHLSPGARLAGGVRVGRGTWIGAGAVVIDGIVVGGSTVVGAGAVVVRDLEHGIVAYGAPARRRRSFPQ